MDIEKDYELLLKIKGCKANIVTSSKLLRTFNDALEALEYNLDIAINDKNEDLADEYLIIIGKLKKKRDILDAELSKRYISIMF